jgi:prepilin-type N-terminal cleavage/methylation domain-containing protein
MKNAGFSLVELVTVIAIISILLTISTLQFNQYTRNSQVEKQIKTLYVDLTRARTEALYQKQTRVIKLSNHGYGVYSSAAAADSGTGQLFGSSFNQMMEWNNAAQTEITIGTDGLLSVGKSICIEKGNNGAAIDSIVVAPTRINMGKSNGTCDSDNISIK